MPIGVGGGLGKVLNACCSHVYERKSKINFLCCGGDSGRSTLGKWQAVAPREVLWGGLWFGELVVVRTTKVGVHR